MTELDMHLPYIIMAELSEDNNIKISLTKNEDGSSLYIILSKDKVLVLAEKLIELLVNGIH